MLTENKKLLFVVTAVLFLVYTLGVIVTTLQIGMDVLGVEPKWTAVLLSFALMFATMLPAYAVIYLGVLEYFKRRAVTISMEPVPKHLNTTQYQEFALRQLVDVFGLHPGVLQESDDVKE